MWGVEQNRADFELLNEGFSLIKGQGGERRQEYKSLM